MLKNRFRKILNRQPLKLHIIQLFMIDYFRKNTAKMNKSCVFRNAAGAIFYDTNIRGF